ncbi:type II toxin-antitoxin system RelE family toxin [Subtercola vilae]|uniref:Type II toxin-antitoxin system RelE/ParE family toxin n=1 Tax=Subtercola vilae TaxID=2056433 RepID=A0A4T2BZK5_9MICO|nr:type II toxin-antitoxin system RelE/ParE family toxin [Subtercola vilae]TIH36151.1 type II toxin-antitoxin system RelE/ParE family toxin [Subtercola vilae]
MTRWHLETTPEFDKAARRLDKPMLRRIRDYLEDVTELENPRDRGKGLSADRAGYWRYRIGDYRVIVEILDDQLVLVALDLGHRSEIY